MSEKVSDDRIAELIAGWESNILAVEFDGNDVQFNENCRETVIALRELLSLRNRMAEGFVLAPREPTQKMLLAAHDVLHVRPTETGTYPRIRLSYRTMLEESQKP